jgi:hypothetical protein
MGGLCIDDLKVGGSFASVVNVRPRLQIILTGGNVEISWPAPSEGFVLQNTIALGQSNWQTVNEEPAIVGNRKVVRISGIMGIRFFRLVK